MPYSKSTFEYTKIRREFGRQPLFQAVPAQIIYSIPQNKILQKQYGYRNPVHREVQATLPQSQHDCNTKQTIMHDTSMNHREGGWPREIPLDSEEMTVRHKRRILHEESYVQAVLKLAPTITHCLDQNNAIEMYRTYFHDMVPQESVETTHIKIANVFRDHKKRPISSIVWTVENEKLVVSHYSSEEPISENSVDTQATDFLSDQFSHSIYIWDIQRESSPLQILHPEHPCWRLASSPIDYNILVGGMENGVVNIFDMRRGPNAVSRSSVYNSHFRSVTGLRFIQSRSMREFFTCAPDGQCLWWDSRNLSEPTDSLYMSVRLGPKDNPSMKNAEGMSSIQFDRNMPTKFLGGTESGLVINCNRMGKTHSEILTNYWNAHAGPVRAVHRSPATMRMFITCGDFSVRIWSEEVRTDPIIVSKPYRYEVSDVSWAPYRMSSYMSICTGGLFYYWDLLRNYKEPVESLQVSKYPLTKLTPNMDGDLVAVGDNNGSTFLLRLSDNMAASGDHDKTLVNQMCERESKREHILDNRLKEIHLKQRMEEEALAALADEETVEQEEMGEEEIDALTEERYFEIVKQQLETFGFTPDVN